MGINSFSGNSQSNIYKQKNLEKENHLEYSFFLNNYFSKIVTRLKVNNHCLFYFLMYQFKL